MQKNRTTGALILAMLLIVACSSGGITNDDDGGPTPATVNLVGIITGTDSVAVSVSGDTVLTSFVAADGDSYRFTVASGGTYTVTPSKSGVSFTPASHTFTEVAGDSSRNFSLKVPTVQNLSVEDAHGLYTEHAGADGFTVLDVRSAGEYAAGHIPGAVNIDVNGGTFAEDVSALDQSSTYLVYCLSGGRSATAVGTLISLGFTDVYNMLGGFSAWKAAGYETE